MKIAAIVANAIPDHLAGAERALHETLEWLAGRGHECVVLPRLGAFVTRDVDGVRVMGRRESGQAVTLLEQADICFTQLEDSMTAQLLAFETQTPLVFYAHSPTQLERLGMIPTAVALVLFNSQHVADAQAWWPGASMILHPPVFPARYSVEPLGKCATLIGLSHRKGVMQFVRAAQDLPSVQFLGVQGAYDDQILDAGGLVNWDRGVRAGNLATPPNITSGPPLADLRPVYANTRVLLVLSEHESWGRVAHEAMVSGIPVIAHPTPGLQECCGDAGIFVDRDSPGALALAIHNLCAGSEESQQRAWDDASIRCLERAAELEPTPQLEALEKRLERIVEAKPAVCLS